MSRGGHFLVLWLGTAAALLAWTEAADGQSLDRSSTAGLDGPVGAAAGNVVPLVPAVRGMTNDALQPEDEDEVLLPPPVASIPILPPRVPGGLLDQAEEPPIPPELLERMKKFYGEDYDPNAPQNAPQEEALSDDEEEPVDPSNDVYGNAFAPSLSPPKYRDMLRVMTPMERARWRHENKDLVLRHRMETIRTEINTIRAGLIEHQPKVIEQYRHIYNEPWRLRAGLKALEEAVEEDMAAEADPNRPDPLPRALRLDETATAQPSAPAPAPAPSDVTYFPGFGRSGEIGKIEREP